jgi:hypothetical protein
MKKLQNKKAGEFEIGMFVVAAAISISLFSFITEENSITGFAASSLNNPDIESSALIESANLDEFNDVTSLSTLSAGNYYIDENGTVYWIDDESSPAVAKVSYLDESQKNRYIYIDREGRLGYILDTVLIENDE